MYKSEATNLCDLYSKGPALLLTCAGFHRCSFGTKVTVQVCCAAAEVREGGLGQD